MLKVINQNLPAIGSVYLLSPKAAEIMNRGDVPGAVVTDELATRVQSEWKDPRHGRTLAIERAAQLGAVLKGLGYRGMHLGGIHKSFAVAAEILDRMEAIQDQWQSFLDHFQFPESNGFYAINPNSRSSPSLQYGHRSPRLTLAERSHYRSMNAAHRS